MSRSRFLSPKKAVFALLCCLHAGSAAFGAWVQWKVADGGNGHWYRLTTTAGTWHDAENEAVASGGHLVTINDAAEQQWLVTTFGIGGQDSAWIGFTDEAVEGTWVFVAGDGGSWQQTEFPCTWPCDGVSTGYVDWHVYADGEPNNNATGPGEDWALIGEGIDGMHWGDYSPTSVNYYDQFGIIEHATPAWFDCNDNGIPDPQDIADCDGSAWCSDCNHNDIPDGCDLANQGAGFDDPAAWSTFDAGAHGVGTDPDGYSAGAFDGRYVYFAPWDNGTSYHHAEVLRYDTTCNFGNAICWETCTPPDAYGGYSGAIFDGSFVYFVPYGGAGENGQVLRYNTSMPFCGTPSSWETFNVKAAPLSARGGYIGGTYDGRYVYFAPYAYYTSGQQGWHGEVLRYDTTQSFSASTSWDKFDAVGGLGAKGGYHGAVVANEYVYFIPFAYAYATMHGEVLRYNRTLPFTQTSSWEKYDPGNNSVGTDPDGYWGGVFDGRYIYFAPNQNDAYVGRSGEVLRFDTTAAFGTAASWATFDPGAQGVGIDPDGYSGVVSDGRYLYFAPDHNDTDCHGEVLRYDTTHSFTTTSSWAAFDPGAHGVGTDPDGYWGVVSDGRFVYFAPFHNGTDYHGEVLRYDARGSNSSDCDGNGVPDECQPDCDHDGTPDVCELNPRFFDDFAALGSAEWTHHGTNAVNIGGTIPGSVYVHGAVDSSPPARITHVMATGAGNFEAQFDIRRLAYSGSGSLWIGWVNVDDYAAVRTSYSWETHDSLGNPASGLFVQLNSGSGAGGAPHRSHLTASTDGAITALAGFDPGPMGNSVWHTLAFGRIGTEGYLELRNRETGALVASAAVPLADARSYGFFHISSIDGQSNNWWIDVEIDNLTLIGSGTADCDDGCPDDPNKTVPGICGCGTPDTDSDGDGTADCDDGCPDDPNKISPGTCGCGTPDADSDGDSTADCHDGCPNDSSKTDPGTCGCSVADTDTDQDGIPDCHDGCSDDPNKIAPGICGCGTPDIDSDSDGTADCNDGCVDDPNKTAPGICGCGTSDTDSDSDGTVDCNDGCPEDPAKIAPGICGCGVGDAIGFVGFLPPIGGGDATGGSFTDPLRAFKLGSTIPVKFTVLQCGSSLLTGIHTLQAVKYSSAVDSDPAIDATPTDAATTGNQFRLTDGGWHFNLSTRTGFSQGTWKLIAKLSDNSQHFVWITIKK